MCSDKGDFIILHSVGTGFFKVKVAETGFVDLCVVSACIVLFKLCNTVDLLPDVNFFLRLTLADDRRIGEEKTEDKGEQSGDVLCYVFHFRTDPLYCKI